MIAVTQPLGSDGIPVIESTTTTWGDQFPLLTLLVLVPVLGALIAAALPPSRHRAVRVVGLITTFLTAALTLVLLISFDRNDNGFQFTSAHQWLPAFGIGWKLAVDGVSLFLVVLCGLTFPLALLASSRGSRDRSFVAWMLLLEAGCIGAFLALDLFLFFVCFEVVLVPMYFLIVGWGGVGRGPAALKFFLYTLAGSAFLFIGMLALVFLASRSTGQPVNFDLEVLQAAAGGALTEGQARWIFLAFVIAFAVKIPIFPFHGWLPDTYEHAPIVGALVSAAVMVKLGTYALVRFGLSLFPDAASDLAPVLLTLAVIAMIYGAIVAAVQRDIRRLLAYSSLSHLGFVVLGTFAFTTEALSGAVLQMISHGVTAAALFLLVGMIQTRRRTADLSELRGMQKVAPVLAGLFTVGMLSSIGVPGFAGFTGEFLILLGTFVTHRWWAVTGTIAVVLAAVYLLWAYQRAFHGEPTGEGASMPDLTSGERWLVAPLIVLILLLGIYPQPVLDRIEPSAQRILQGVPGAVASGPAVAAQPGLDVEVVPATSNLPAATGVTAQ